MKKIKGQGTLTKLVASKIAKNNKIDFSQYISESNRLKHLIHNLNQDKLIDIDVVSFSSSRDVEEQILSILSFIAYVGNPTSWVIYSDGTHSATQINYFESAFAFLKIIKISFDEDYINKVIKEKLFPYKRALIDYASKFPLGKKLFFYLNYPVVKPTIFLDSDVLFYEKAFCLNYLLKENTNGWFLPDAEWGNLDSRYTANTSPQHYQVNSGLFLANGEIQNLSAGLDFLKSMDNAYEYFSEQSILHIILLENSFMPLDPRIFVLNSDDQFDFGYLYQKDSIAARHYTGPVRHKMWQRNWKWHLSIS